MKIVIIGGSNIDYIGYSTNKIILEDSNPGSISVTFGGVARNIVENLCRLGVDVTFITAIGNDVLGKALEEELIKLNCHIIKPISNLPSSAYLSIHDVDKDMVVSICDNEIIKGINHHFLDQHDDVLKEADYILVDANLDKDTLDYFFAKYHDKKVIAEGVSASKVIKLKPYLKNIYLMKVNKIEYEYLEVKENNAPTNLIVTNGAKPVAWINGNTIKTFEVEKVEEQDIASTVGSGDAFISGVIYGLNAELSFEKCIGLGLKASKLTLKAKGACAKNIKEILSSE